MFKLIIISIMLVGCSNAPVDINNTINEYDNSHTDNIELFECDYNYKPNNFCALQDELNKRVKDD